MKMIMVIFLAVLGIAVITTEVKAGEYTYSGMVGVAQTPNRVISGFANRPCYFFTIDGQWFGIRKDKDYYKEIKEQLLLSLILEKPLYIATEDPDFGDDTCSGVEEVTYSHL